ncbi:precorrin-6y C5,15-methyltransferase (decarboxylating) subunit CbiE [Ruegeria hyattellae]|uniref:precorrin-6y C5,15-methyltransferase (decarboxylating) subunit CbiE n=1 Tax=Ruegeria hyattellae TaxID=3233337 RepID=UPI00355AE07B
MAERPWLTVIGLGEDGPDGLPPASRHVLDAAQVVMGPPRHLSLLPEGPAERVEWPVPFSDGLPLLEALRGKRIVVLASGDPFWFGVGSVIARHFTPEDWTALPGQSTFSLAASRLAWPLEKVLTFGLHAAPLTRLRPYLAPGMRALVLLRDGTAVRDLAAWLMDSGFGESRLHVLEALGGPRERHRETTAEALAYDDIQHPVCVGLEAHGDGRVLPRASGLPDDAFESEGQITKRPIRALTLSALAPKPCEHLWDIGGGSGSVGIEWLLSDESLTATSIEPRADRAARILRNADALGVDRLNVVQGEAPGALAGLPMPNAVFVGGGLSTALLEWLKAYLPSGTRLVANAVTLESEALLAVWHKTLGGDLLRIELANAAPLGPRRGWKAAYPVVQWSVTF